MSIHVFIFLLRVVNLIANLIVNLVPNPSL